MKNVAYLLLVIGFSALANPVETVTVSGKIANVADRKISLRGESFIKEITLKPDGSFSETFKTDYNGTYLLSTAENRMSVYLTRATNLKITADNQDFYKSILFTGKGSTENQYIARKTAVSMMINQEEMYRLDENAFLSKLKEIVAAMQSNYDTTKFEDNDFKQKEAKNIYYFEQLYFQNYPSYHAHYSKTENFKPTASFPKLDATINFDDESAFLFSNPYKQLVNAKFNETAESKMKPTDQFMSAVALPEIKKLKSSSIKNALSQVLSYEISSGNPNSAELYNQLMALSTNALFKKDITEKFNKIKTLSTGKPSPGFDYENYKGGKTSLESLKGTYVYIDVWATWCGPCRQEIPSLQKVEEQFKGKNVRFVSISIDARKDNEKWKKMVADKLLGGIQLFADNDWNSKFVKDYGIDGIPRFILIGPDGTIVNADAPRPSDPKLIELFTDLKI
ncbi:MAG: TlpA family protein disulfide reductase [Burkholderiales bacterium]|nr:TlpA family protein disulfide reductase [Flavobacterium sp.]